MAKVDHKPSQNQRIIEYIRKHGSITHLIAERKLGVMRLASRICDLKRQGYTFHTKMEKAINRYGEPCRVACYRLIDEEIPTEEQKTDSEGK